MALDATRVSTSLANGSKTITSNFATKGEQNAKDLRDSEAAAAEFSFQEMSRKLLVAIVQKAMSNAVENAKSLIQSA